MIIHKIEQYSEEWWTLRKGRFTASMANKLLTPAGRPSKQYQGEIGRIIAEKYDWQEPAPRVETYWMQRGLDVESEARHWLEFELDVDIEEVGMVTDGDLFGASPDGLVRDTSIKKEIPVEIKCPMPSTHIGYLLDGKVPDAYVAQVHFQMAMMRAPYAYFMSYCPEVEPLFLKVGWSEYTDKMVEQMDNYINQFRSAHKRITGKA